MDAPRPRPARARRARLARAPDQRPAACAERWLLVGSAAARRVHGRPPTALPAPALPPPSTVDGRPARRRPGPERTPTATPAPPARSARGLVPPAAAAVRLPAAGRRLAEDVPDWETSSSQNLTAVVPAGRPTRSSSWRTGTRPARARRERQRLGHGGPARAASSTRARSGETGCSRRTRSSSSPPTAARAGALGARPLRGDLAVRPSRARGREPGCSRQHGAARIVIAGDAPLSPAADLVAPPPSA
jgi:hypothetical protein